MILSSPLKAFQARIGSSPHGLSGLRLRSHRKLSCDSQAPILQHTATDQLQETGQTDKILSVPPLKSPISASRFLAVLEGACLAGALLLQVYVLRAAKLNQQGDSRLIDIQKGICLHLHNKLTRMEKHNLVININININVDILVLIH